MSVNDALVDKGNPWHPDLLFSPTVQNQLVLVDNSSILRPFYQPFRLCDTDHHRCLGTCGGQEASAPGKLFQFWVI